MENSTQQSLTSKIKCSDNLQTSNSLVYGNIVYRIRQTCYPYRPTEGLYQIRRIREIVMLVPGNTRTRTHTPFLYWPLQIELPRPISAALVPRHVAHNSYHQEIKQSLEEGTSFAARARARFLVRGVIDESLLTQLVPLLP